MPRVTDTLGRSVGAHAALELPLNLAGLREAARHLLGVDEIVADGDFEDAAAAADKLRLDTELLLDFSRQTGGPGEVVSAGAVLDGDVRQGHRDLLSGGHSSSEARFRLLEVVSSRQE